MVCSHRTGRTAHWSPGPGVSLFQKLPYPCSIKHARVFDIDIDIDVETCAGCDGTMRIIASIEDPVVIKAILAHLSGKAYSIKGVRALYGRY
jgi:hypothetical protein